MTSSRLRASLLPFAAAAAATAALAGCGGGDDVAALAERAPADSFFYGEAVVQPEGDLQTSIEDILASFPGGDQATEDIIAQIEEGEEGVDFEEDIEPWLGERVGVYFNAVEDDEPQGAALIETEDEDAASDSLAEIEDGAESRDFEGVELFEIPDEDTAYAVFDGIVAFGDVEAVEQAITTEGGLSEEERFSEEVDGFDADTQLAFGWLDVQSILDSVPEEDLGSSPEEIQQFFELTGTDPEVPVVFSLAVEDNVVRFDQISGGEPVGDTEGVLAGLPGDSIAAFALSGASLDVFAEGFQAGIEQGASEEGADPEEIQQMLEQAFGVDPVELIEGIETLGVFVRGGGIDLGGAAFIDLASEQEASDALDALEQALTQSGQRTSPLPSEQGGEGFQIEVAGLPVPLLVTTDGARILLASSPEQAAAAGGEGTETLEDSGTLGEATDLLGDDEFTPAFYLDGGAVVDLVGAFGASDPSLGMALPYLEPLGRVVSGTRTDGDRVISRTAIEIEE